MRNFATGLAAGLAAGSVCLLLAGCGSKARLSVAGEFVAGPHSALPSVPQPGSAARTASGLQSYTLTEAELVDKSPLTRFDPEWLNIYGDLEDELSWATFGITISEGAPVRLDVFGSYGDLWVAVADADSNTWVWIDGIQSGALVDLTPYGDLLNDASEFYVCLACAYINSAYVTGIDVIVSSPAGDSEPPVWNGAEGITSLTTNMADFGGANFAIEWGSVSDAGSGPEWCLVYSEPVSRSAIDWSRPKLRIPATESGMDYFPPGPGEFWNTDIDFNVAVRDMDSAGNITSNENWLAGRWDDSEWSGWPAFGSWSPGNQLVLTWDDPAVDFGITVTAPNLDWGDPESPEAWVNTRSFLVGPESKESGLAEERVVLGTRGALGFHMVDLRLVQNDEQAHTCELKLLDAQGRLIQEMGQYTMGEGTFGEMHIVGYLTYF